MQQTPSKKQRRRPRSVDGKFDKCKKDNLYNHGITEDELKMRQIDGEFAVERLAKDRMQWREGRLTMGSLYWAAFRLKWRDPNSAFARLEAKDPNQVVDARFYDALESYLKGDVGKEHLAMDNWMDQCEALNQAEYCALNRAMLLTPVAKSFANAERVVRSMSLARVTGCCDNFQSETAIMRSHWDAALQKHLSVSQSQDISMSEWWEDTCGGSQNLLPKVSMDAVIALAKGEDFCSIADHVNKIHASSVVGKILMEKIRRYIAAGGVASKLQVHVDACKQLKNVDTAALDKNRKAAMQELSTIGVDPNTPFDKARPVKFEYRRKIVSVSASSPVDMYYKMREGWLTGLAVDQGLVDALWCEDDFVQKTPYNVAITLEPTQCTPKLKPLAQTSKQHQQAKR